MSSSTGYPSYLPSCLIPIIKEYENYQHFHIQPPVPIHRRVTPEEYMILQRYWNEPYKIMKLPAWNKDPFA
jgi:hypothetical protein